MAFEQILKTGWIIKRPEYSLYLGVIFSVVSFLTSLLIFSKVPSFIGISTILFTVILSVPTINNLLDYEEKAETKARGHFFRKHAPIVDFFIYFFIGVFIVFFVASIMFPGKIFSESNLYGVNSQIKQTIAMQDKGLPLPPIAGQSGEVASIFKNNVYVMAIAFILSLFYGTGALFLIILNASIFASALADIVRIKIPEAFSFLSGFSFLSCNFGIMFFHLIPEVSAYLLAAIAGGVLGKAFLKEKFMSKNFKEVLKDALMFMAMSLAILFIGAIIEIYVSKRLFAANVCVGNTLLILLIALFLILLVIFLEYFRKRHFGRKNR